MKKSLFLLILFPVIALGNIIWGKTGHRITGQIAQEHLTGKARRALNDLLDGHSLAFVSTFGDDIKAERSYSKYSAWHYANYPLNSKYIDSEKSKYGDIITGIEDCIAEVKDENNSREERVFYLKMLVHFIGDLHQPMHASRGEDKGGNDIQVQWFGQGSNLHRVWDTNLINSYGMTYSELANELTDVSKKERKSIQEGTIYDWIDESHVICGELYESVEVGEKLGYRYTYDYNDLLFQQLQRGGLRLAKVLNDLFA
ncbi:S1/P1 nuclease [Flagellimonas zhangzhouensis]|uniref:S1/P1 Nuclease n=1 Tax=Flagellimonas zhangzhouensis TaxID=1073328 RepID=A0A1H2ZAN5_9FLAO|nr:S1/P1 nuclease [Allomuricauda zhangzhouensis]SDR08562.1 S1/P1 Nuclease [Allomuricauda zhangzhouensis]SDX14450.1 S1/P1 Nuclease [Allomuricauda zhangzhouensis]